MSTKHTEHDHDDKQRRADDAARKVHDQPDAQRKAEHDHDDKQRRPQPSSAADAARKFHEQQDAQHKAERERNEKAQGAANTRIDRGEIDAMVRAGYENIEQPGLDPHNMPGNVLDVKAGERPAHKSTLDLEDITGNPGHRGVTPYAPATSINRAVGIDGVVSLNEPPDVEQPQPRGSVGAEAEAQRQHQHAADEARERNKAHAQQR